MSAKARAVAVDLDAAISELLNKENGMRAQDQADLYGKKGNGGSVEAEPSQAYEETTLPVATTIAVIDPPVTLDPTSLINERQRHTESIFNAAERVLDEFDAFSRELRTTLRDMKRQCNASDAAFIRKIHQTMTVVPNMKSQIRDLVPSAQASGD